VLFNGGLEMSQGIRETTSTTLHSVAAMGQPDIKRAV